MPITLFDVRTQKPQYFDNGSQARDALLSGSFNFDPAQEVYLKDADGAIVKTTGKDATSYALTPGAQYSLATDEDVSNFNRARKYDNPVQQGLAAVEGVVNAGGLGFGNALTRVGIELVTPRGSEAGKKYGEAVKERREENPMSNILGEVTGTIADPVGAVGLLSKGAEKVAVKVAPKIIKGAGLVPVVGKVAESPLVQNTIKRGVQFGVEGATAGASYETGRQLLDKGPINADAILSEGLHGGALGTGIGIGFGAAEHGLKTTGKLFKTQTKKLIDKIVGAPEDMQGEVFYDAPKGSLRKEAGEPLGRTQRGVKLSEEGEGIYKYKDDRKEGIINGFSKDAKGLDLSTPEGLNQFGDEIGVSDFNARYKAQKKASETLDEFASRMKQDQKLESKLTAIKPYMSPEDVQALEHLEELRSRFRSMDNIDDTAREIFEIAKKKEEELLEKYLGPKKPEDFKPGQRTKRQMKGYGTDGSPIWEDVENYDETFRERRNQNARKEFEEKVAERSQRAAEEAAEELKSVKAKLSEYDYIKSVDNEGKKFVHVFNEGILPEGVTVRNLGKAVTPLDFEAGQMSKQFKITPSKMQKMGNTRLNEVSQFILDRYPKEGSMLKKITTSADHILDEINTVRNRAINELGDTVEQALNITGTRQRITTEDIARYVETEILPRYVDPVSKNPLAGLDREYGQIKGLADGYKNNGFTTDQYGRKLYRPMDVKELRELRMKLDQIAKYNSAEPNALQDAARELRTWVEDNVVSRIGKADPELVKRYNTAKKDYGLSVDAHKIVDTAAKRAAKETKFSLFYSGIGAAAGASIGGAPGAIIGGLAGGAAKNVMNEFSGAMNVFLARNLGKNVENYEKLIESTAKAFFKPVEKSIRTYNILPKDTDQEISQKDYKRYMGELSDRASYMEDFVDKNEELFALYPETSDKILQTSMRARDFLVSKIPQNPYNGNPWKEKQWAPSPLEMQKYMRYREAVNNPASILKQIKNGYATPEAVEALNDVYPDTKQALFQQFIDEAPKAKSMPLEKRVELYKIFGIQMDSFMSGEEFNQLQQEANGQAVNSSMGQDKNFKPQNAMKIDGPTSTLGQSTVE